MEHVWTEHWAFVAEATGQPLVLGEIGGFYTGQDATWQDWALQYGAPHGPAHRALANCMHVCTTLPL